MARFRTCFISSGYGCLLCSLFEANRQPAQLIIVSVAIDSVNNCIQMKPGQNVKH